MSDDIPDHQPDMPEPSGLRKLRVIVTLLTATMIIGILAIFFLIFYKIMQPAVPDLALPETLEIPEGETAQAITQGRDWIAIVTIDAEGQERIRILDVDGSPRQVVDLRP